MTHILSKRLIIAMALAVCFAMMVSLPSDKAQAAAKKPALAKSTTVEVNGKKSLSIKKNGYKITKVVSVKSKNKSVAKADATKSRVTVYGINAGTTKITVNVKAKKGKQNKSFKLVTKATVKAPEASLSAGTVYVGDTAKVNLKYLAKGASVTYTSSDSAALPVSSKGVIRTLKSGTYSVKVKAVMKKTKYAKQKTKTLDAGTISVKLDVDKLMEKMTLKQKVAQMIMPSMRAWEGVKLTDLTKAPALAAALRKNQYGGIILFGQNVSDTETTTRLVSDLQINNAKSSDASETAIIPYMMALDQEGGAVNRLSVGTRFTGSMALGATGRKAKENTVKTAEILGEEMSAVGFNVDLAPCIDVVDDLEDPGWSTRIFSDDPQTVSKLGRAFKTGLDKSNVITTYKHFPGAGDGSDYPTAIFKTKNELLQKGLATYEDAIDNGAEMLMVSATTFPLIDDQETMADGVTKGYYPASSSKKLVDGILRKELGFDGVVITDALEMDQFIYEPTGFVPGSPDNIKLFVGTKYTAEHDLQAAEKCINAGCDILLLPTDMVDPAAVNYYDKYVDGIVKMVRDGVISEDRINESAKRILFLKQKRDIFSVDTNGDDTEQAVENAKKVVGSKENHDAEKQIAKQAVTLLKNDDKVIPVSEKKIDILFICNSDSDSTPVTYALDQLKSDSIIDDETRIENLITGKTQGNENAKMHIVIDKFKKESGALVFDESLKSAIGNADRVICLSKMVPLSSPAEVKDNEAMSKVLREALAYTKQHNKQFILLSTNLPSDSAYVQDTNETADDGADAIVCSYLASGSGVDPTAHTSGTENVGAFNANVPAAIYAIFGGTKMTGTLPISIPKAVKDGEGKWHFTDEILYERGYSY